MAEDYVLADHLDEKVMQVLDEEEIQGLRQG